LALDKKNAGVDLLGPYECIKTATSK